MFSMVCNVGKILYNKSVDFLGTLWYNLNILKKIKKGVIFMKKLAEELKGKYSEKEIVELVKYLKPSKLKTKKPTIKDTYKSDITNLFSVIKKNNIRPVIEKCMVKNGNIIGTDLECTVIIPDKWNIPNGLYTKQMMNLKTYPNTYKEDLDEFPIINTNKQGELTTYNKTDLENALSKTIFAAAESSDDLSVNVVRFTKDSIASTDNYRLVINNIKGNSDFSLPLNTSIVLQKMLKNSDVETVEIYLNNNEVEIYIGDIVIKSRVVELAFPDVKHVIEYCQFSYEITINHSSKELAEIMKKLHTISKDNSDSKNSFIFDFIKKELRAVGVDNKINIPIEFDGETDIKAISLNAKSIEEYLKTVELDCVKMSFQDHKSAVKIEDNYYTMPLAAWED
jgi:hypothetical protein